MERHRVVHVVRLVLVVILSHSTAFRALPADAAATNSFFQGQLDALADLRAAWNHVDDQHVQSILPGWTQLQADGISPCFNDDVAQNWQGVQCLRLIYNSSTYEVRIIGLVVNNAHITGHLPPSIWNLEVLISLVLTRNRNLTGRFPDENLATNKDALLTLDLHGNGLIGEFPRNLSQCRVLTSLDLSDNQFSGNLTNVNFNNMSSLQTILLSSNQFSGDIPQYAFANLSELITLDLSDNSFTGEQLPSLTGIHTLQTVNFSANQFTGVGDFSSFISASPSNPLETLDLSRNKLNNFNLSQFLNASVFGVKRLFLDYNSIDGPLNIDPLWDAILHSTPTMTLLSLTQNNINEVIYSELIYYPYVTILLEGNPFCIGSNNTKDDFKRCMCGSGCYTLTWIGSRKNLKRIVEIAFSVGASVLVLVVTVAIFFFHKFKKDLELKLQLQLHEKFEEFDVKPTIFKYDELRLATRGFHTDMKLGQGGFGAVYKGILPNGNVVAVKQLFIKSEQGIGEFCNEIVLITEMKHRNLVKLKGCCLRQNQRLLVYEYCENYDLQQVILERKVEDIITWPIRFNICVGIAQGLHYLHALAEPKIIHRDIKASNILLDNNFQPKIADFGFVLLFPDETTHIMASKVAGTMGYVAPEYATLGQLSEKVDVYSFGVVLLEIVSGRKNIDNNVGIDQEYLIKWAGKLHQEDRLMEIVDHELQFSVGEELEVQRVINIALLCLQLSDEKRPTMAKVVAMFEGDQFDVAVGDLRTSSSSETSLHEKLSGRNFPKSTLTTIRDDDELPLFNATVANDGGGSSTNTSTATIELQKVSGRWRKDT